MIRKIAILSGILAVQLCFAQAPAGAPAGSTGLCNDGTYSKASTKMGACFGHKGVKTWWGATKSSTSSSTKATSTTPASKSKTSSTTTATAPATKPAATPAPSNPSTSTTSTKSTSTTSTKTTTAAPGGGPGLVWLNTASNVYHCYGSQYYGKTKAGSYMSESDAKAKGAHPVGGKPCSAK